MARGRGKGSGKGPLVKVELAPGRFVKMYKRDAAAQGLLAPKKRSPTGDKARRPEHDKAVVTGASDTSAGAFVQPEGEAHQSETDAEVSTRVLTEAEEEFVEQVDDFTVIEGIGAATAEMLHDCGIRTFEALREMETCDLPARVARAIEGWRLETGD